MNQRIRFRRVSRLWTMAALAVMAWPGLIAAQEAAPKPGGKDDEAKAKTAEEAKDEPGFPASLAGFSDEGVFNLF
ncbi:MAG: hypothetical protein ACE5EX_10115, partial [Phycisphaerae bacterium]